MKCEYENCTGELQPFADSIMNGEQRCVVLDTTTDFRGDVLIISGGKPDYDKRQGQAICLVELYEVKPVKDMTAYDRQVSGYDPHIKLFGYCYMLRNPRRVIEVPAFSYKGLFKAVFDKFDITVYPPVSGRLEIKPKRSWLSGLLGRRGK